jgi:hypothetical protein
MSAHRGEGDMTIPHRHVAFCPYETSAILNERHVSEHVRVGLRGRSYPAEAAA